MAPHATNGPGDGSQKDEGLHLVIIGAGLAGLAAALSTKLANPDHRVTICEAVKNLQEIGAGLQITPNGTRLLSQWGLVPALAPLAAVPKSLSVHRYDGTKLLAHEPDLQAQVHTRYGHPFWDLHRVDLQRALINKCVKLGVEIKLNSRTVSVDFDSATVHLHDGRKIQGDLVLLTDGLWSTIRPQFLGRPSPAKLTGDLAYRITIHIDDIPADHPDREELVSFIQNPTVNFWVGPYTHVVGYSVSADPDTDGKPAVYNIVMLCPDDLPDEVVKAETTPAQIAEVFASWDPFLRKFISTLSTPNFSNESSAVGGLRAIHKWKLMWLNSEDCPTWASPSGKFFIAGDACHPMLPYLAQGANSSLEDGAVFGHLLGKVSRFKAETQLPKLAAMYQTLRMERGRKIQLETFKQRDDFHLPDGPEQEARDKRMMDMLQNGNQLEAPFPSRWTCPEVQQFLYGYDAYAAAEEAWKADPF
ncbi:hypothetical protein QBC37DRAFT_303854 [Rhypophila decipiens]|uniref:FAD-binding domain-containing protein n=1 Tax=Rhypophila decipiens TaxID=261697 RepID=A0AAN6YKJ4_9PEZI|nr:hypothetical protein QBC37DRAFT_303854 [Rhypophila decipiens]